MNRTIWLYAFATGGAPHKTGARANHRVAPTHHVKTLDEVVNVGVSARQIGQATSAQPRQSVSSSRVRRGARVFVAKRIVVSEDRRATVDAALVRGDDVAERFAFVEHVVPGERKVARRAGFRTIFQRQVSDHPRAELKLGDVPRRILAVRADHVPRDELRRGEDHALRAKAAGFRAVSDRPLITSHPFSPGTNSVAALSS